MSPRLRLNCKKCVDGDRELQRAATYTPVEPVASALMAQVLPITQEKRTSIAINIRSGSDLPRVSLRCTQCDCVAATVTVYRGMMALEYFRETYNLVINLTVP